MSPGEARETAPAVLDLTGQVTPDPWVAAELAAVVEAARVAAVTAG